MKLKFSLILNCTEALFQLVGKTFVLLDSFNSPETIAASENIVNSITQEKKVHSIRMRKLLVLT
jgi:hypothetical protein